MDDKTNNNDSLETLEGSSTVVDSSAPATSSAAPISSGDTASPVSSLTPPPGTPKPKQPFRFKGFLRRFNIYLLLFLLVVVLSVVIIIVAYLHSKGASSSNNNNGSSQSLSESALKDLANSSANVGSSGQVLNVQSNAVFAGTVLVRSSLQVAGGLQVGGSLSLAGLTVSGNSVFDSLQANKNLTVLGNESVAGTFTVQKSLAVSGGGSFGGALSAGQITTGNLQISGDLNLTHHITAGGSTPSRSNGNALGNGGTSTVVGSDTSGTLNVNTGTGTSAGCFATINFAAKFNATPHVVITPVGASAAGIAYYVTRTTSSMSICTASAAPSSSSFAFDYLVLD